MRWRVKMPTLAEYNLVQLLLKEGAGRIIYGDERKAKYGRVRIGNLLSQHGCRAGFCVASRGPELICWDVSVFDSRRLTEEVEEAARQPERTIYLTDVVSKQRKKYGEELKDMGKVGDYRDRMEWKGERYPGMDYGPKVTDNKVELTRFSLTNAPKTTLDLANKMIATGIFTTDEAVEMLVTSGEYDKEAAKEALKKEDLK